MAKTPKITAANRKAADKLNMVIEIDRDSLEFVLGFHEDGQLSEEVARDADFSTAYAKAQAFVAGKTVEHPTSDTPDPLTEAKQRTAKRLASEAFAAAGHPTSDTPDQDEIVHEADPLDRRSDADIHDGPAEHPTSDMPPAKPKPGTIVAKSYKVLYGDTQSCGDLFSILISDLVQKPKAKGKGTMTDEQSLFALAEQNDVDMVALWPTANVGQRRMNLSNVLRGRARRGLETWIGPKRFQLAETEALNPELSTAGIAQELGLLCGVDGGLKWVGALDALRAKREKAEAKEGSSKPQPEHPTSDIEPHADDPADQEADLQEGAA